MAPKKTKVASLSSLVEASSTLDLPGELEALYQGDDFGNGSTKVVTLRSIPEYVPVSFRRMQRRYRREDGLKIPQGYGVTVCWAYGLELLLDSEPVQQFIETLDEVEDQEGLTVAEEVELHRIVQLYDFTPDAPQNTANRGKWSFRVPEGAYARNAPNEDSGVKLTDGPTLLRMHPSQLAVACIMRGLANQPGVNPAASKCMLRTFSKLRSSFGDRAARLGKILNAFRGDS